MAGPMEVGRIAAQRRHDARVAAAASALREMAQQQYDAIVAAQQRDLATFSMLPDTPNPEAVETHIETIRAQSDQLDALRPQLLVDYWRAAAESQVTALEAEGA